MKRFLNENLLFFYFLITEIPMSEKPKTGWQLFLYYVWLPFSIFMTAIDLIQIGDNFWPTLIHWMDFFQFWIDAIRSVRDWLFSPFGWIGLSVPGWIKDYLVFGLLVANSFIAVVISLAKKEKSFSYIKGLFKITFYRSLFSSILTWPILLLGVILIATGKVKIKDNQIFGIKDYRNIIKIILRVIIVASIIILINYLFAPAL